MTMLGKKHSQESIEKIREGNLGKKLSNKTKLKISLSKPKKTKNPIAVAFGSLAIKGLTKEQIMNRVKKAADRSKYLRDLYGWGYWNNPGIMKKIKEEKL